jgi:hypothetical protein
MHGCTCTGHNPTMHMHICARCRSENGHDEATKPNDVLMLERVGAQYGQRELFETVLYCEAGVGVVVRVGHLPIDASVPRLAGFSPDEGR